MLANGVRRRTRCALARSAQTTAASLTTKHVCPSAHMPPRPLRSSAHPEGQREQNIHTGACARETGPSEAMARMDVRLFGCSAVPPLLAAPAAGRLRGGTRVGARVLRALTRRGCQNEAAPQRSEFHGAPRNRHDAGLPRSEAQGSQTGGRLFFGDFLLAKQKKVTRTPGDSRPPPSTRACSSHRQNRLRQAQPEQVRREQL